MNKPETRMGDRIFAKRLKAFTLAEVLITLVIIGVIAAITVPTLMAQHQKTQLVTQLKQTYAIIQNGFRAYIAREGVTNISDTTLWSKMVYNTDEPDLDAFQKELGTIFVTSKHFKYGEITDGYLVDYGYINATGSEAPDSISGMLLNNGAIAYYYLFKNDLNTKDHHKQIKDLGGKYTENYGEIFVDVNGLKKPNKYGRDLFYFVLTHDGSIHPMGSVNASLLESKSKDNVWNHQNGLYSCLTDTASNGYGCAARIIEEGWEMKY